MARWLIGARFCLLGKHNDSFRVLQLEVTIMFSEKNERLALLIATIIFGTLGVFQLYRAAAGLIVSVGGTMVPLWASVLIGCAALFMAFWLGGFLRKHKPVA